MRTENRTMDHIHRGLLKKFHTLCSMLGMDADAKHDMLQSWGVESSRDLDQHQLIDICAKLSAQADIKQGRTPLDKLRKQTMAAIGSWLRKSGKGESIALIKGIACRATGYANFNKIPRERLRNLIALFNNKRADSQRADSIKTTTHEVLVDIGRWTPITSCDA